MCFERSTRQFFESIPTLQGFEKYLSMVYRGRGFSTADNYTQTDNTLRVRLNQGIEDTQRNISTNTNSAIGSSSRMPEIRDEMSLNTLYDPNRSEFLQNLSRQTAQ